MNYSSYLINEIVWKIILCDILEADFAVYLALDRSGFYYQYTELALGHFIDKLSQASYIWVLDKYVVICHLCNETDRNWISMIDQITYQTLRALNMVIMFSDRMDIPTNLYEDLYKIIQEWYYNEYEFLSALIR